MKIFLFYCKMAIKITGKAHGSDDGRVSGNTPIFFWLKEVAYKTLVGPKLEYAAPILHPYHGTQIGHVEKVQRTATRSTCRRWRNTSSVGEMLY